MPDGGLSKPYRNVHYHDGFILGEIAIQLKGSVARSIMVRVT